MQSIIQSWQNPGIQKLLTENIMLCIILTALDEQLSLCSNLRPKTPISLPGATEAYPLYCCEE